MDKSTRALYASADNSAAIDALRAELKRGLDALRTELKGGSEIKIRTVDAVRSGLTNTFGEVTSENGACVIIAFTGSSGLLYYNKIEVKTGPSPIFAVLPKGTGEVSMYGNCSSARAFIIEM